MNLQTVQLIDPNGNVVAAAQVAGQNGLFAGRADLAFMPPRLRQVFEKYEETVNNQVFSILDEIEDRILSMGLQAVFPDGQRANIRDLQIYPSTSGISFRSGDSSVDGQMIGQEKA